MGDEGITGVRSKKPSSFDLRDDAITALLREAMAADSGG